MAVLGAIFGQYWYYPAALLGMLALLALYTVACVRALRSRSGTLEWIQNYDRPSLAMPRSLHPLSGGDAFPMLAVSMTAALIWGGWYLLVLRRNPAESAQPGLLMVAVLVNMVLPMMAAGMTYLLCRRLFGSRQAAVLSALLVAVDMAAQPVPLAVSAAACLLLSRCLTADRQDGFGDLCTSLIGAFSILAVGCYFEPSLALMAGALLLMVLAAGVCRFVHTGRGWLIPSVLAAVLTTAAVTVVMLLPAALLEGMPFPSLLISGEFYRMVGQRLLERYAGHFRFAGPLALPLLACDLPLVLAGVAAWIAAMIGTARRRDCRGLLLLFCALGAAAMLLLTRVSYVLTLPCALCLGYVWHRLCSRGRGGLAVGGAVCLLLMILSAAGSLALRWLAV